MRGKRAPKRKITPDSKYGNVLVAKFINRIMRDGKKTTAEKVVYDAFAFIDAQLKAKKISPEFVIDIKNSLQLFEQAIKTIAPVLEVKGRRIGGANYQVPMPVRGDRKYYLAFSWLLEAANKRKGKPMSEKLALELIDVISGTGETLKTKDNVHRMAEANRAFAHFAR